jgi:hypothetical protein
VPRMIELIKQSTVPANMMRTAALGALSLPEAESMEILVYLASHSIYGQQAQMTLAGWDEVSARAVASDPQTRPEVLNYMSSPRHLRPCLLPTLLENPSVPETRLAKIASLESRSVIEPMLASERIRRVPNVLLALAANPKLTAEELERVNSWIASGAGGDSGDEILEVELTEYLSEHAAEIKAAEQEPFFLYGFNPEQLELEEEPAPSEAPGPGGSPRDENSAAAHVMSLSAKAMALKDKKEKQSTIQKIMKMTVGERVQLALKGSKDDRFVLIRDGARVVSSAVVDSPKLTDSEVEMFTSLKSVHESVLRCIAGKRKFIKRYAVIRTLTSNPRCPLDVSLSLVPHLLTMDLKHLSNNKNVGDSVRKLALKLFRDRMSKK